MVLTIAVKYPHHRNMILTDQLLTVARAYCQARNLSLARVSTLVFNEGKKLDAIESRGADLATGRFEAAMQWFSDNWPGEAEWPEKVARPERVSS